MAPEMVERLVRTLDGKCIWISKPVYVEPKTSEENRFAMYRYNLERAVAAMRARGINPVDRLPEHIRLDVISGLWSLEDAIDHMAEYGYRGCSTTFMRDPPCLHTQNI
jgi:hypothetical protein